ncbi:hypothetical protein ACFUJ0_14120 [Streptomyces sp. NPDC057242]|uniref:hypothetical protein n=2 Tax=Streptomyces TaxID=1883 RepID=UPI003631403F
MRNTKVFKRTVSQKLTGVITLSVTLMLTACGSSSSEPKTEASAPARTAATPTTAPVPELSPYMDGYAHGQERRTDPDFKSTEKSIIFDPVTGMPKANPKDDTLTVAMRVAGHCQEWAQQKYTDFADQGAYSDGCRDGINDRPPASPSATPATS